MAYLCEKIFKCQSCERQWKENAVVATYDFKTPYFEKCSECGSKVWGFLGKALEQVKDSENHES